MLTVLHFSCELNILCHLCVSGHVMYLDGNHTRFPVPTLELSVTHGAALACQLRYLSYQKLLFDVISSTFPLVMIEILSFFCFSASGTKFKKSKTLEM